MGLRLPGKAALFTGDGTRFPAIRLPPVLNAATSPPPCVCGPTMPIATVKELCTPNALLASDSLVEQVAQIEDFASGRIDGHEILSPELFHRRPPPPG
jgi:hypothetical protein